MSKTESPNKLNAKRRTVLKGTAAILASGAFPAIHAQEKIVLRYLGTAVNQDKQIADKFKADTGIEIQYVARIQKIIVATIGDGNKSLCRIYQCIKICVICPRQSKRGSARRIYARN